MTRFTNFTDEELDAMEAALCNEGLVWLVEEIRIERRCRENNRRSKLGRCAGMTIAGYVALGVIIALLWRIYDVLRDIELELRER